MKSLIHNLSKTDLGMMLLMLGAMAIVNVLISIAILLTIKN